METGARDLAVGARDEETGGVRSGAVHLLFLMADGTAKHSQKIAHETGGGPMLSGGDLFGSSLTSLGDLDGDGALDMAVRSKVRRYGR